jgi:hypothetical protein
LTKSTHSLARKSRNLLAVCFIAFNFLFLVSPARAEEVAPTVTTIVTPGGDDVSYHIPLAVSVVYDGVTYENVYATTNSVITFGRPDGTYWTYPTTPSVSIESKDWWVLPQQMPDTHFIINVSEGGFQVDGNYRPYGTFTGDTTSIIITAQIQTDGTVAYSYAVDGPLVGNERTGAVLTDGTIVPLEEVNIIEVEEAPVLEPEPVPPVVEPEPTPVEPEPEVVEPVVPTPEPVIVFPVLPTPEPEPVLPEEPVEEPVVEEPVVEEPVVEEPSLPLEPEPEPEPEPVEPEVPEETLPTEPEPMPESHEESVTLDNGVVLTAQEAVSVALLQNPAELLQELFTNPGAALAALGSVGADMTEEEREESEKVIVAAVIVGQIATQSAVAAAASAAASTYRRKP